MRWVSSLVLVVLLSGCGSWPQNAEEFRERARGNPIHSMVDTFEVQRPLADVAGVMRRKSTECLSGKIKISNVHALGVQTDGGVIIFKPTFISHANRAELHVQRKAEGTNQVEVGSAPPDGLYRVVMDATALSPSRTRIDIYRMTVRGTDDDIRDAFVHWAKGDNLGCPVLGIR